MIRLGAVHPLPVIRDPAAWRGLLFLLTRLPLGAVLFLLPAGLGAAGLVLLPALGLGLPVLLLAAATTWGLATFERELGRWWLAAQLTPRTPAVAWRPSRLRRVRELVRNPVLWKSLAYLLLQLPVGGVAFALVAGGSALALAAMASPFVYCYELAHDGLGALPGLLTRVLLAAAGAGLGVLVLHLARLAGRGYRLLIELMLGLSETELLLATARAEALAEHARAEALDEERRELIVNMSHELRTPAASIRGHAEALLEAGGEYTEEDRRRFLEILAREAARLGALTDDMLAVARNDPGGPALDLRPVPVEEVVEHAVAALEPIARRDREVTLLKAVDAGVPPALADRDRLDQVLMNLVRNAITYTPDGGMVAVRLSATGDGRVALAVEDTGVGIPERDLERIFERFYRTDGSRSRQTGGFGLGLAISRELVEAMEGTLVAESTLGQGSRFTVYLKAAV
jgi:two-component system, OmpR family, phosphate regulon sensor histidine kinase PhoR